jgi:hypothetical protein
LEGSAVVFVTSVAEYPIKALTSWQRKYKEVIKLEQRRKLPFVERHSFSSFLGAAEETLL